MGAAAFAALVVLAAGGEALAHAAERGLILLLPTGYYLVGGAVTVAVTFLVVALNPRDWMVRLFRTPASVSESAASPFLRVSRGAACLLFLFLLYTGFAGSRDPLANPLPLAVWSLGWVGLTLAHALFGDLWHWINPWSAPYRLLTWLRGRDRPLLVLPPTLGHLPALAGFFGFVWFELVDIAPNDPARLAWVAGLYWLVTLVAMGLFGEAEWRRRGEFLSVFFRYVSLLSPFCRNSQGQIRLTVPGARAVGAPSPNLSAACFILLGLASVSFDGLSRSFWYLDLIGVNPLAFPGRSAVIAPNSLGLLLTFAAMVLFYGVSVYLGARLARHARPGSVIGPLVLALLPIALAYLFAHYLTALLTSLQYALAAASDPLGKGWDLLGLGAFQVTTSFLSDYDAVRVIWNLQAGAIVVGHIWAMLLAHAIAFRLHDSPAKATLSQIPVAIMMVAYTLFGLWLLSTPTGA